MEIALACGFIVASDRAAFADTHAVLGLTPGWGLSAELLAVVGVARARQMTLTGASVDARTALSWGLVNEVVRHLRLMDRVLGLAAAIAAAPAASVANALGLYRAGQDDRTAPAVARERRVLRDGRPAKGDARHRFDQRGDDVLRDRGL
ncbi:enoyl-CoA hydratase-related protein [Microbacterium sp. zg.Y843]|nr:enoyl-CoA hydratase-related protein [Microbacterium sp. zg.Y843]MCR2815365.1 enoyl-CoA hydratase-related protein [Microbacterium sp. zg.Y843]